MEHKIIRYENQMTVAMDESGMFYLQNGASPNWLALAQPPCPFENFQLATAGLVATRQEGSPATYILPKDPRSGQFQSQWQNLAMPYCVEMVSSGILCACIGSDGTIYLCGFNLQQPKQISTAPNLPGPSRLAINAYGLYANSNQQSYMSPNAGATGTYGPWGLNAT